MFAKLCTFAFLLIRVNKNFHTEYTPIFSCFKKKKRKEKNGWFKALMKYVKG